MSIIRVCLVAAFVAAGISGASAQTAAPAPSGTTSMKMKLSTQKLKDMKAKWSANRGKLKACRVEVKKKGLIGDDRWFFIEDCMAKS